MNRKSLVYTKIGYSQVSKMISKRRSKFSHYWFRIVSACGIRVINLGHLKQLWGNDLYKVASSYYWSGDFNSLYKFIDRFPDLKTMHYGMSKYNISITLKAYNKRIYGFKFIKVGLFRIDLRHVTDCNRFNNTITGKEAIEKTYNLITTFYPDIDTEKDLSTQILEAYRDLILDRSEQNKLSRYHQILKYDTDELALTLTILLGKLKLP